MRLFFSYLGQTSGFFAIALFLIGNLSFYTVFGVESRVASSCLFIYNNLILAAFERVQLMR